MLLPRSVSWRLLTPLAVLVCSAQAQNPGATANIRSVLISSVAASGGPNASALQDAKLKVQITSYTPRGPVTSRSTITMSGFDKVRIQPDTSDRAAVVSNGAVTNIIQAGKIQVVPQCTMGPHGGAVLPWLAVLHDAPDARSVLTYLGSQQTSTGTVHRIQLSRRGLSEGGHPLDYEVGIDYDTLQISSLGYKREAAANAHAKVDVEFHFGNYQEMNGMRVPTQISEYIRGRKTADIQVLTFTANQGTNANDFQVVTHQ